MRKDWQYEKLGDISSSLLIEKAKKRFNPNDVIRYIDISSIDNINQRLIFCVVILGLKNVNLNNLSL